VSGTGPEKGVGRVETAFGFFEGFCPDFLFAEVFPGL
jgi:hypothetical protein